MHRPWTCGQRCALPTGSTAATTTDLNETRIVLPMSSVKTVTYVPGCSRSFGRRILLSNSGALRRGNEKSYRFYVIRYSISFRHSGMRHPGAGPGSILPVVPFGAERNGEYGFRAR